MELDSWPLIVVAVLSPLAVILSLLAVYLYRYRFKMFHSLIKCDKIILDFKNSVDFSRVPLGARNTRRIFLTMLGS